MSEDPAPAFLHRMARIADGIDVAAIDAEMGEMCSQSLFALLRQGTRVSQERIDAAEAAFTTLTERLMPADLIDEFIAHACAMGIMPQIDQADLVPGFTSSETLAGGDAAVRLASPNAKFTQEEALACLRWNVADPRVPVAIAHLIGLTQTYADGLCELVSRRSPEAAAKLEGFSRQWSPKNVLKFVNIALFVTASAKSSLSRTFTIDQPIIAEAMNLLNRSGAFTWNAARDAAMPQKTALRIHCPAQPFLHKLVVNQGGLVKLLDFVGAGAKRTPCDGDLAASLELIRRYAAAEENGIRTFGQEWSRLKLTQT